MSNEIVKKEENKIQINTNTKLFDSEEMIGLNISLPKIKVPSGGGVAFEVPGDDPNSPDLQKEFNAVILYHHPVLSYYKEKYTGGNQVPDCGSFNGITGVGEPGGKCIDCPLNQYGSGENKGKACKTKRKLYLLREGESIPTIFTVPTGSVNDFSNYYVTLRNKNKQMNEVITKFSLVKANNKNGIVFSKVVFTPVGNLTQDDIESITVLSEQVKTFAKQQEFSFVNNEIEFDEE